VKKLIGFYSDSIVINVVWGILLFSSILVYDKLNNDKIERNEQALELI